MTIFRKQIQNDWYRQKSQPKKSMMRRQRCPHTIQSSVQYRLKSQIPRKCFYFADRRLNRLLHFSVRFGCKLSHAIGLMEWCVSAGSIDSVAMVDMWRSQMTDDNDASNWTDVDCWYEVMHVMSPRYSQFVTFEIYCGGVGYVYAVY